jgi:DNA-binding MurR/RpiR family transcriptional regulator
VLATHLVNQLNDIRPNVELLPAGSSRLLGESLTLTARDVVAVFDYKRYQNDTVTFAREAARRKASVILITDPLLSPAAEVADHVLTFSVVALPPFDSPIGGFAIVETLIAGVAGRLGEAGRLRMQQMEALSTRWMWDERLLRGSDGVEDPELTTRLPK